LLARLVRFYGIDPERFLALPQYIVAILISELPAVEAADLRTAIQAALSPHLEEDDRRSLLRSVDALVETLYWQQPPTRPTFIEYDPAKAAAWFAAMGAQVIHNGEDYTEAQTS